VLNSFDLKGRANCPVTSSAQSNLTNKSRLKLLQRREEQLQELFSIARSSILTFAEDEGRYSQFLEGAVVQGLLQLMEPKVTLLAREQDAEIMGNAGETAAKSYTRISGREVSFELETTLSNDW
jgi:V-type H+-transporting ATPase subunit E